MTISKRDEKGRIVDNERTSEEAASDNRQKKVIRLLAEELEEATLRVRRNPEDPEAKEALFEARTKGLARIASKASTAALPALNALLAEAGELLVPSRPPERCPRCNWPAEGAPVRLSPEGMRFLRQLVKDNAESLLKDAEAEQDAYQAFVRGDVITAA